MRIISKQELKDILDKHGKWLRKENGGERVDLSYANLRYANLSSANLSSANLSYADLSYADLMIFQFQRHQAFYSLDDNLRIGCLYLPLDEWVNKFEEIGKREQYSDLQIKVYGSFIKMCAEMQLTKSDRIVGVGDDE